MHGNEAGDKWPPAGAANKKWQLEDVEMKRKRQKGHTKWKNMQFLLLAVNDQSLLLFLMQKMANFAVVMGTGMGTHNEHMICTVIGG